METCSKHLRQRSKACKASACLLTVASGKTGQFNGIEAHGMATPGSERVQSLTTLKFSMSFFTSVAKSLSQKNLNSKHCCHRGASSLAIASVEGIMHSNGALFFEHALLKPTRLGWNGFSTCQSWFASTECMSLSFIIWTRLAFSQSSSFIETMD